MSSNNLSEAFVAFLAVVFDELAEQREQRIGRKPARSGPRLLRQKEAAQYLAVSESQFKLMRKNPQIPEITAIDVEGMPRFRQEDLDKFISRCGKYED